MTVDSVLLSRKLTDSLFPADLPEPSHWEERYPPRELADGAEVTRFAPSPTGFLHIGSVYTAGLDLDVARHSGGVYLVRIEDTDQARFVADAAAQFASAFAYFGIASDEDDEHGDVYRPYHQSARAAIYLSFARDLLRRGKAYPCFATKDELADIAARQKTAGALPGYYGQWAIWRDAPEEQVRARLDVGDPYVLRLRSPGRSGQRVSFTDEIRGEITFDDNRNDVVILKSSDTIPRLPTYHFAHAVDDHLMRVSLVIRTDEWLSSVPLHLQLFDALGFPRIRYAHAAPLMKQENGSRRKLSKRKDPEADVAYYISRGYPAEAVLYYLRGLANGRLAEMPLPQALTAPIRLAECGSAGPLIDMAKLDDISADFVASLNAAEITERVATWADAYDQPLVNVLRNERTTALRALSVERGEGVPNPRKDLRKWADFRTVYGYFFPQIFQLVTSPTDPRFGGLPADLVRELARQVATGYIDPGPDVTWFDQVREAAASLGFAPSAKAYKKDPDAYPGSIADASAVIRVLLTGTRQSPDMALIAAALGRDEVLRRLGSITTDVALPLAFIA